MRKSFAIISLVLITFALSAKAFLPFSGVERHGSKFQLSLNEALEMEVEESKSQDDKIDFDGPLLSWMVGLPVDVFECLPTVIPAQERPEAAQLGFHAQKQYLLFGVLRI